MYIVSTVKLRVKRAHESKTDALLIESFDVKAKRTGLQTK